MKKFIGDKRFYKMLIIIVLPIVLQQFLTQFVSLLDNLMVGQVGNDEMTGVSLANQLLFVFNLGVFGSLSGASIFATQFYGAKNKEGYLEAIRFKWIIIIFILFVSTMIFSIFSEPLVNSFIHHNNDDISNPVVVLREGRKYLLIMLVGNIPFAIKEIFATSLREMKETLVPMLAGVAAIVVNLLFNYLLIFGKLGFPQMGVSGAAIATVISRFVELIIVVVYILIKRNKYDYFNGMFKHFIKFSSIKKFLPKTLLLCSNEVLWSLGLTLILRCYSIRGLDYVSALNISNTVNNLFITMGTSMGNATAIILGNYLGSRNIEEAKSASYKILPFAILMSSAFALIMFFTRNIVPSIFNTDDSIRESAKILIIIGAVLLPMQAFNTCCYFILRAGGRIFITILFDSMSVCLIRLPIAFILSKYTCLSLFVVYGIVTGIDLLKCFIGYRMVDKGIWLKTIV